jgi:hypothetical protein
MYKSTLSSCVILAALLFSVPSWADSPPSIAAPDTHSLEVTGKITMFRVQVEGMGIGQGADATDAEVIVAMNNNDKEVYVVALRTDSPAINTVMAETLRDAFNNNRKVKLYYLKQSPTNYKKIHMVQISR